MTPALEARLDAAARALPVRTRRAMENCLRLDRVIAGAYTDERGGVCPMLGAHRRGGRTDFAEFARAWDAFTGATEARPVTEYEVLTLRKSLAFADLAEARAKEAAEARAAAQRAARRRTSRFRRRPRVRALVDALFAGR